MNIVFKNKYSKAFTIVELLVVIVVIGILASITIVSYAGISNKATIASLQSDLTTNVRLLKMYNVEYGTYPSSLDSNNCPSTPKIDSKYCLKPSSGNEFTYIGNNQTFTLIDKNIASSLKYKITESSSAIAYAPPVSFASAIGGATSDNANSISPTSDGGYVITGQTNSFGLTNVDAFIAKYADDGSLSWMKTWGSTTSDYGYSVSQTSDGGYIMSGTTGNFGAGSDDAFIAKYTSDGTLSWSKTWGGVNVESGDSIVQAPDGTYLLTGGTYSYGAGNQDIFIAKFAADGTILWSKTWGGAQSEKPYQIINTDDGGFAVSATTSSKIGGDYDALIIKYAADGTVQWQVTYGDASSNSAQSIAQTSDSGYLITSGTSTILKYNSSGVLQWGKTFTGVGSSYYVSIKSISNGWIAGGYVTGFGAGGYDGLISKYNTDGSLAWTKTFGNTGDEYINSITQTIDGNFIATGRTNSYGSGGNDILILKAKSDGIINNCSSPLCQIPTPTVSAASLLYPALSTITPTSQTITPTSPTASVTSPSPTSTTIISQ